MVSNALNKRTCTEKCFWYFWILKNKTLSFEILPQDSLSIKSLMIEVTLCWDTPCGKVHLTLSLWRWTRANQKNDLYFNCSLRFNQAKNGSDMTASGAKALLGRGPWNLLAPMKLHIISINRNKDRFPHRIWWKIQEKEMRVSSRQM